MNIQDVDNVYIELGCQTISKYITVNIRNENKASMYYELTLWVF